MAGLRFDADVAVVGLGAMGATSLWRIAARRTSVIGFEQFAPGHGFGSSHGHTRLFRVACLEHPELVVMARKSRELWFELQERYNTPIIKITGAVMIGPPDSDVIAGTRAAAAAHGLPVEELSRDDVYARFPAHQNLAPDHVAIWDPEAGVVHPEAGILASVRAAEEAGATVYPYSRVTDIKLIDGGAEVITPTRSFIVRQVVVTTGAWLNKLVPELPLRPMRTPMMWFQPKPDSKVDFSLQGFPVFIRAVDDHNWLWGHGSGDGFGVKVGPDEDPYHRETDPDQVDRAISAQDWETATALLARAVPELDPVPVSTVTCMVTHSPDAQFQIGRPHNDPRLIVGGGCSGHAFKHATGIGEYIAQLAVGEKPYIKGAFIDPNRFLS